MLKILRLVEKINRSNLTVLLQGATGTGKTLAYLVPAMQSGQRTTKTKPSNHEH